MTRLDLTERAAGLVRYAADAVPRPHLVAAIVTAAGPHSRVCVGLARARAVPGVVAALGPEDDRGPGFSPNPHGNAPPEQRILTSEPRFHGDIVAAVVARDRASLRRGVAAVDVREIPLPAVLSVTEALADGAPTAGTALADNLVGRVAWGDPQVAVDEAIASAPHRIGGTWTIGGGHPTAIELPCAGARSRGGRTELWTTSQTPGLVAAAAETACQLPPGTVHAHPVPVGGGFGGKEHVLLEPLACLLAGALPDQVILVEVTRAQALRLQGRHRAEIALSTGFDDQGRLLARRIDAIFDAGAYGAPSLDVASNGALLGTVLYPVPMWRATATAVLTNSTPAAPFRGYGGPEVLFAVESQLDEIALRLDVDPLEIRRINGLTDDGVHAIHGWQVHGFGLMQCLDALAPAREEMEHQAPPASPLVRGIGVAALADTTGIAGPGTPDRETATATLEDHGVHIWTAAAELGQGILESIRREAASAAGASLDAVRVSSLALADPDGGAFGSRGTAIQAGAAALAARRVVRLAAEKAAGLLGGDAGAMRVSVDGWEVEAPDGRVIDLDGLGRMSASAEWVEETDGLVAGAQLVQVAVHPGTGEVTIERVVSAHAVGRLVDPVGARGQVLGGVVQGIGIALWERPATEPLPSLTDLLLPTAAGSPPIQAIFVAGDDPDELPRGLGEAPIMAVAPAIANAIRAAVGQRITALPLRLSTPIEVTGTTPRRR
jgi:CO/xanthine dehydrogenase Mo-binding subunit